MLARGELILARILVVDDHPAVLGAIRAMLQREGFVHLAETPDPRQIMPLYRAFRPDVVVLDLNLPGADGFDLLGELRSAIPSTEYLPVLVLTGDSDRASRNRALASGAADFVAKPFDREEFLLRLGNLLTTRFLHRRLDDQARWLGNEVAQRTEALERVHYEICDRLARAAEFRDDVTGEHTRRVGELCRRVGRELGMEGEAIDLLGRAAPLHDLGKIGIPDRILLKPGKLDSAEIEVMRRHSEIGAMLLSGGQSPLLQLAEQVARCHHERWDGTGYPHRLSGDAIPLASRVVAVVDYFDAMTHDRPYRTAWPVDRTLAEIRESAGGHFDPAVVDAFFDLRISEVAA